MNMLPPSIWVWTGVKKFAASRRAASFFLLGVEPGMALNSVQTQWPKGGLGRGELKAGSPGTAGNHQ